MRRLALALALVLAAAPAKAAERLPIFDAHLHYNDQALMRYPPAHVLALFREHGVNGILANSRPNEGTRILLEQRPADLWVVAFLRPYRVRADVGTWFADPAILELIEQELPRGIYQGIGEFHIHGQDAAAPQVGRIVRLAVERRLWLHAHADVPALHALHAHDGRARVIWAHTGFGTPAPEVAELLQRYPALMAELSYRSGIVDGAGLTAEWRELLTRHADRFLVGSDTWVNERWESYGSLMADYRAWLEQLPREAAEQIAFCNAERIFGRR